VTRLVVAAAALLGVAGCIDYLEPGQPGQARYFTEVRGAAPLPLVAPIADRDGNLYVAYGSDSSLGQATAYVGHAAGGWSGGCDAHEGDARRLRGWIGRGSSRAWYVSGDALVRVSGIDGSCVEVLDRDPVSGADLRFLGVAPFVHATPSRATTVALVISAADPRPFWAVVDLDEARFLDLRPFGPGDATEVVVAGAGAWDDQIAVFAIGYTRGGEAVAEAVFVDRDGRELARVGLPAPLAEDSVQGFLQSSDGALFAGLLADDRLLLISRADAAARAITDMTPAGVHLWDDRLYLVGTGGGSPVVAPLDRSGNPGPPVQWQASLRAAEALRGPVAVIDERAAPWRQLTWNDPVSALGGAPFVSAQAPHRYAEGTTLWVIAGPSFDAGGQPQTSIAALPFGISYP
jgi:hypothetical protein